MGKERDAKDQGRQREGGERRDGIRVDFALLRFILLFTQDLLIFDMCLARFSASPSSACLCL